MALQYSTIVSIVYFAVNIIFMFGLAFYVHKKGDHKVKSKSYLKDIWNQKKIFYPLIIHFYDTATDIGVIYNWAELAKDEKTINYESVDMKTFFWCGITFLLLYRFLVLCWALFQLCTEDFEWCEAVIMLVVVLFDLTILVAVYESFNDAQGVITKNAARRAQIRKKKQQLAEAVAKQLQIAIEMGKITTDQADEIKDYFHKDIEIEIEPSESQMTLQLLEAVTESMPQIVIQSVFIIRSANDTALLNGGSNIGLVLFSVLASLFSISNKFVWLDKTEEQMCDRAISLKPRLSFPDCVHYWYFVRALWRLFHVLSKFAVFTLIWTVLGGAWLPMWIGVCFIGWIIVIMCMVPEEGKPENCKENVEIVAAASVLTLAFLVAMVNAGKEYKLHFVYKWIETTVGLTIIAVFAFSQFDCAICADPESRYNERALIYFIFGVSAHLIDLVLYLTMYFGNILADLEDVIHHNRWSFAFGIEGNPGEPFKNLISNYEIERITGIRLAGVEKIQTIQFQVNGIWRDQVGRKSEPENMKELVLNDDEFFNQVSIIHTNYMKLGTNKENFIEAGDGQKGDCVLLRGNFKLVDCKGKHNEDKITVIKFLWYRIDE